MKYKDILNRTHITQNLFNNNFEMSVVKENDCGDMVGISESRTISEQEIKCYLCAFIDYFDEKGITTLIKDNTTYTIKKEIKE